MQVGGDSSMEICRIALKVSNKRPISQNHIVSLIWAYPVHSRGFGCVAMPGTVESY
jgi:hypothetical protein